MMQRSAQFSENGKYRQRLNRWWGPGARVGWFLLNPSTAGAELDDHTATKCIGFTARWGFDGLTIINPWDLVCTDSSQLPKASAPASFLNAPVIHQVCTDVDLLVVGWGCSSVIAKMRKRHDDPLLILRHIRRTHLHLSIECLGRSKSGDPRHPLMLAYSTQREPFEVAA